MEQCGRQPAVGSTCPMRGGSARPAYSSGIVFLATFANSLKLSQGKEVERRSENTAAFY